MHVSVRFGFIEPPDLEAALVWAKDHSCSLDLDNALFFASRDEVGRSKTRPSLSPWRRCVLAIMYRNAVRTPDQFDLLVGSFIEISRQISMRYWAATATTADLAVPALIATCFADLRRGRS